MSSLRRSPKSRQFEVEVLEHRLKNAHDYFKMKIVRRNHCALLRIQMTHRDKGEKEALEIRWGF